MLFELQVNKWRQGIHNEHKKRGFFFVTCLLDFKFINEKDKRFIILNVGHHSFTRSFAESKNKVVIKTVHYHATINATFSTDGMELL